MDFVFTVCDNVTAETCPTWPGQPMTAHWGVPDPAIIEGDEVKRMQAFREAFRELENRIKIFTSLPIDEIDSLRLQEHLDNIGNNQIEEALTD
jgi:arsenate reductase